MSMVLSPEKENSVAQHPGQGGSHLVHVPLLYSTATGKWLCCGWTGSHFPHSPAPSFWEFLFPTQGPRLGSG